MLTSLFLITIRINETKAPKFSSLSYTDYLPPRTCQQKIWAADKRIKDVGLREKQKKCETTIHSLQSPVAPHPSDPLPPTNTTNRPPLPPPSPSPPLRHLHLVDVSNQLIFPANFPRKMREGTKLFYFPLLNALAKEILAKISNSPKNIHIAKKSVYIHKEQNTISRSLYTKSSSNHFLEQSTRQEDAAERKRPINQEASL